MSDNDLSPNQNNSSDDEEDSGLDEYEKDGFLVEGEEEVEDADSNDVVDDDGAANDIEEDDILSSHKKTRKRKRRRQHKLDQDDIELVKENLGISSSRATDERPGKYRRLKKKNASVPSYDDYGDEDDDIDHRGGRNYITAGSPRSDQSEGEEDYYRAPSRRMEMQDSAEMEDLFGLGDDELLDIGDEYEEQQNVDLYQYFEPVELEENLLTKADEIIRECDMPERLQRRLRDKEPPEPEELQDEAYWIIRKIPRFQDRLDDNQVIQKLENILHSLRVEYLEIPFIATYLKDLYMPEFTSDQLWEVFDLDEKWCHFYQRKTHLRSMIEGIKKQSANEFIDLLYMCKSEEELTDIQQHVRLRYIKQFSELESEQSNIKRPRAHNFYNVCRQSGIMKITPCFGITAKQFGENLIGHYVSNVPNDHYDSPEDAAAAYLSDNFPTVELVLKACRYVISQDIFHDLNVRKHIRSLFAEYAVVSTFPTEQGRKEIDSKHEYARIKRLNKKPVHLFSDNNDFGLILKAVDDKLLTVRVEIPEDILDQYFLQTMLKYYVTVGTGEIERQWNQERQEIMKLALHRFLVPFMCKELLDKLSQATKERIIQNCYRQLKRMTMYGSYKLKSRNVMALILGRELVDPLYVVTINKEGAVIDYVALRHMQLKEDASDAIRTDRKQTDMRTLREFIVTTKPGVIVVGATCIQARDLMKDIEALTREVSKGYYAVADTVWGSIEVADICATSAAYVDEFPNYSTLLRCGVSLARTLQDPLSQLAVLFNQKHDITFLKLDPLQSIISRPTLMQHLERTMVDSVNAVGIDANRVMEFLHLLPEMRFIAGLGRSKVEGLRLKMTRVQSKVQSREQLLSLLEEIVGKNCIGFIRISQKYVQFTDNTHTILDETRIHPDHYETARKLMRYVVESSYKNYNNSNVEDSFNELSQHHLHTQLSGNLGREFSSVPPLLLEDIKKELMNPFDDPRIPYEEPDQDKLFELLTGESAQSFHVGMEVVGVVRRIIPDRNLVEVKLESGLIGEMDRMGTKRYKNGEVVQCYVKFIDKRLDTEQYTVGLEEIDKDNPNNPSSFQDYHDRYLMDDDEQRSERRINNNNTTTKSSAPQSIASGISRKARSAVTPMKHQRLITHPLFKNINFSQAEKELENAECGELIFRPSSKGSNKLTLTYKFHDECVHVEIDESEKPGNNELLLGQKLQIGDDVYEDLNHIVAHYLEPIVVNIEEMKRFRHFSTENESTIEQQIRTAKQQVPASIPYKTGVCNSSPGRYVLYYLPNKTIKKEYISCTHKGFRFRGQMFSSVEKMIAWFKKHWKEGPQLRTHSSSNHNNNAPVTSMRPLQTPTSNYNFGNNPRPPADLWDTNTSSNPSSFSNNNNNNNNWGGITTNSYNNNNMSGGYNNNNYGAPNLPMNQRFQIIVLFNGQNNLLQASGSDRIYNVKQQLYNITGVPVAEQQLSYLGRALDDNKQLWESNIKADCQLKLERRQQFSQPAPMRMPPPVTSGGFDEVWN